MDTAQCTRTVVRPTPLCHHTATSGPRPATGPSTALPSALLGVTSPMSNISSLRVARGGLSAAGVPGRAGTQKRRPLGPPRRAPLAKLPSAALGASRARRASTAHDSCYQGKGRAIARFAHFFILEKPAFEDMSRAVIRKVTPSDVGERWCWRRGSNPHGTKYHRILSPTRLPVPPLQRV